MNRHDLKDQVEHDQFTDAVSGVVSYTQANRAQVIRWSVVAVLVLAVGGGIWAYFQYQKTQRRDDLAQAMAVVDAQIGAPNDFSKTYPTEEARDAAATQALTQVVAKDGSSEEGMIALYQLAVIKAKKDQASAESQFRQVADSGTAISSLAKIALAQLYIGQNKAAAAQDLLRSIVNKPTDVVSKAQAIILLAQLESSVNPNDARGELKMLDANERKRPAVNQAADAVAAQLK